MYFIKAKQQITTKLERKGIFQSKSANSNSNFYNYLIRLQALVARS